MANESNLKPIQSKSEARKKGANGGKKSGEVRRKKRLLKDCMLQLLDLPVSNTKHWNKLSKLGLDVEDIDNRALLTAALFTKAVECGDVAAFREIRNLIGEDGQADENGQLEKLLKGLKDE